MKNHLTEEQNIANDPSTVAPQEESQPRKKTMSEAALAANRANAKKCTGPKTREGKFKASLNALKLCRYSNAFAIRTKVIEVFDNFFRDKKLRNETNFAQSRLFCAA